MRVRRFFFAVHSNESCPWACQSVEVQGCAKHAWHGGKHWQLFANRPTAGACMAQAECGLAAWPCLVGLGGAWLLCDFVRIDRLGGQIFCAGFSGLRGRMPADGTHWQKGAAWVRTRLHRCQTRQGMPCLRNTDQASGKGPWQTTHSAFPGYLAQNPCRKPASVAGVQNHAGGAHGSNTSACKNGCGEMTTKKGGTRRLPL